MRIGIGAILGVLGGPATYARELIRALAVIDQRNEYVVITEAPSRLDVAAPHVRCAHAPLGPAFLQPAWDHGWVPMLVRRHRLDLYHGTKGMLPLWCGCPAVVTVHDLAVYHQPETFAWLQRIHQKSHTPFAVRHARRVIADSEDSRRDILDRFRLPGHRVVAIPLAASPRFSALPEADDHAVATALRLPQRYVLYAGTIQPRKHVEALVTAFTATEGAGDVELLIAGRVRPGYTPAFLTHAPPRTRYLGPVTDAQLAVLYRRALALCSPSSYEGFGLSLLEAMMSGCLVIAARNSAVTELVADCGVLVEEPTVDALRAALLIVMENGAQLEELRIRALARATAYRWETTARRTLAVYEEAMEHARAGS